MRWSRSIRTLVVFVLLGALATVVSSWAIHAVQFREARAITSWSTRGDGDADALASKWLAGRRAPTSLAESQPAEFFPQELQLRHGIGWRANRSVAMFSHGTGRSRVDTLESLEWFDIGTPVVALQGVSHYAQSVGLAPAPGPMGSPSVSIAHGLELWRDPSSTTGNLDRFALPLLPIWPGFAINTAVYALLLFIGWRAPGVIRRAVRRRRGRCVACGYDRGGLDAGAACPECGVATRPAPA